MLLLPLTVAESELGRQIRKTNPVSSVLAKCSRSGEKGRQGSGVRIWRPQDGLLEPGELSKS